MGDINVKIVEFYYCKQLPIYSDSFYSDTNLCNDLAFTNFIKTGLHFN